MQKNGTKNTAKATKTTIKASKKAIKVAKETAKATAKGIKATIKITIKIIKAMIAAAKTLAYAIISGGWIAVLIIVIITLIALICTSVFGIFFSSENTGSKVTIGETQEVTTMSKVISDINKEFMKKITDIQNSNSYDECEINSNRAEWKDVLSIYAVKVSGGKEQTDVITIDDNKVKELKNIFWEMNEINHNITEKTETKTEIHLTKTERKTITIKTLHINVTSKTVEEMAEKYNFNQEQMKQLTEIRDSEYASMWSAVIYGTSVGSNDIVAVALSQVGNVGGEPYWSWYGFKSREEWCACFVSWCANECNYIEKGIIPRFAGCGNGVDWFKACLFLFDYLYLLLFLVFLLFLLPCLNLILLCLLNLYLIKNWLCSLSFLMLHFWRFLFLLLVCFVILLLNYLILLLFFYFWHLLLCYLWLLRLGYMFLLLLFCNLFYIYLYLY